MKAHPSTICSIQFKLKKNCICVCVFTEKPKVAFYAALTNAGFVGPFNIDITLKFSKVYTNVGKAYNPSTGNKLQVTQA